MTMLTPSPRTLTCFFPVMFLVSLASSGLCPYLITILSAHDNCVGTSLCLHGGVCVDLIGDTACMCDHTGHTGEHCEIEGISVKVHDCTSRYLWKIHSGL